MGNRIAASLAIGFGVENSLEALSNAAVPHPWPRSIVVRRIAGNLSRLSLYQSR